jgi:eukaryotic-like serine/threonine-protein kinase
MTDPLIGGVLADRFRVTGLIGEGQAARVYSAEQLSMERKVAVKILRKELSKDRASVERFRREVEAVKLLRSPHTIAFYDFGEHAGQLFIVMELLEGRTLRERMERGGPFETAEVIAIVDPITSALAEAHAAGVIHRDLKPENVFLCPTPGPPGPFVKVLDFGLAKLLDGADRPHITAPSTTVGTPAYLAPEMARPGRDADARVDLYALGVMTFEMLAGERPYQAITPLSMLMLHRKQPIPSARGKRADLPAGVDAFLQVALAKDPEERPPDALAFARALRAALA